MRIKFVEIQNFRKLKSVRIDFGKSTTLFVGANNSGKTSAMAALGYFLVNHANFTTIDFTLSNWTSINKVGAQWESLASDSVGHTPTMEEWTPFLPSLDLWLEVKLNEIHHVRDLLPTLDWEGGLLGVRLRFEPKKIEDLYTEYLNAIRLNKETKSAAEKNRKDNNAYTLGMWPRNMRDFLDRKLKVMFTVRAYLLDPSKQEKPINGVARPQPLPNSPEPVDGNPLDGLIRIDVITAQRGLDDSVNRPGDTERLDGYSHRQGQKLSHQFRTYYSKHIDPSDIPEHTDLDALEAIELAETRFDERLREGFAPAIRELESLGYPGVTDPKLQIATNLRMTDGLNHDAAVQYEVHSHANENETVSLRLPEERNGLGYQNLISIVFTLMSFRDDWMRVGKAGKLIPSGAKEQYFPPPLHLVLIEEPEAHLHAQVQQVFIRKAYDVLRNHAELGKTPTLQTQLVVSTHSSHIAHECQFSNLRYFRRLPGTGEDCVPTSAVINLSEVFGTDDQTDKFVTRYLISTHCDLFFADAAILVEGAAERMLVPHFIRKHFPGLNQSYMTLLEINGSHAHRLRALIEHLGLTTLIITDIDSVESSGRHKATPPKRDCSQLSGNATLKTWHPAKEPLDDLLDLQEADKVKKYDIPLFSIRVAYQIPIIVEFNGTPVEALAPPLKIPWYLKTYFCSSS